MIHVFLIVSAALIVYKLSIRKSTVWGIIHTQSMHKEISTNCAVNAIISGLNIESHQGRQQNVLCVLPCCELPFNAFPRASLETIGAQRQNTIFSIGHPPIFFSQSQQRDTRRKGRVEQNCLDLYNSQQTGAPLWALKSTAALEQHHGFTVSGEAFSVYFLALLLLNMNRKVLW